MAKSEKTAAATASSAKPPKRASTATKSARKPRVRSAKKKAEKIPVGARHQWRPCDDEPGPAYMQCKVCGKREYQKDWSETPTRCPGRAGESEPLMKPWHENPDAPILPEGTEVPVALPADDAGFQVSGRSRFDLAASESAGASDQDAMEAFVSAFNEANAETVRRLAAKADHQMREGASSLNASDSPAVSPEIKRDIWGREQAARHYGEANPVPVYFFPDKKTIVIGELVQLDDRASRTATISAMGRQWPRVRFGGTGRPETVDFAAHVGTYRLMESE